jgi:hypothetical protein
MQNCPDCYGKKWFAKISPKTGLQLKNRDGKLLWRCWRCGRVQVEPTVSPQAVSVRTDANILYFDLEVAKSIYYTYGHKVPSKYLRADDLAQRYFIICWSASYVGNDKVWHQRVTPQDARIGNDSKILEKLRDLMNSADIWAGHNVDNFDVKRMNTRLLLNKIELPTDKKTHDTLKIARKKFFFDGGNGLDNISKQLGLRGKDNINNEDWLRIVKTGDSETLKKVDAYCQGDVTQGKTILEKLMKYSGKRKDYGAVAL